MRCAWLQLLYGAEHANEEALEHAGIIARFRERELALSLRGAGFQLINERDVRLAEALSADYRTCPPALQHGGYMFQWFAWALRSEMIDACVPHSVFTAFHDGGRAEAAAAGSTRLVEEGIIAVISYPSKYLCQCQCQQQCQE